ncbi:hypothetical protein DFH28DRAFT_972147 [Melampsora americana]|nr:hypothetical protein DFH28DRAFT_972147 [Melampsora americana]
MVLVAVLSAVSSFLVPNPHSDQNRHPHRHPHSDQNLNPRSSSNLHAVLQPSTSFLNSNPNPNHNSNSNANPNPDRNQTQHSISNIDHFDPPEDEPPPYDQTFNNNNSLETQRISPSVMRQWSEAHQCYHYVDSNLTAGSGSFRKLTSQMNTNQSSRRHLNDLEPSYPAVQRSRSDGQQSMSQQFLSPMIDGHRRRNRSRDRRRDTRRDDCKDNCRESRRDRFGNQIERSDRR